MRVTIKVTVVNRKHLQYTEELAGLAVMHNLNLYNDVQVEKFIQLAEYFQPHQNSPYRRICFQDDVLQFIGTEEGRARPKDNGFVFDYFIKDHLGNTRMVLTDEQQTDAYPVASMETANAASEKLYYTNIDETRSDKPAGYPDDTYTNPNDKVARLNSNSKKIGPAILLKVMSGDQMNIRANAYYRLNGASAGSPSNPASELLTALAGSLQGATMNKYGMFQIQNSGVLGPGIADLLQRQTDQHAGSTRPKAFLNWILLDEQFKIVNSSSGFAQVGGDDQLTAIVKTGLPISQNGYLYVYTSNESPVDVFFDNLQVTHVRGPLLEETHYYPFGLVMSGISSKGAGSLENKRKWNKGSELQSGEFSDGSGLELYATQFRSLDPQLGRFWQIDPKPDYSQSLYSSMGNNPILYNDPLGDTIRHSFRTGFLGIFGKKANLTYDEKNQRWNNKDGSAYTGKTTKFSNMVLNDLKTNQANPLGNTIVTNLATDKLNHNIVKGDPNSNNLNDPNIYYSGSVSDNQKILQGGKTNSSPSYVVLGHEMAHKFDQNLGIRNFPWFGTGADQRGVDEYNAMYYENVLRQANGLPLRTTYQETNGVTQGDILNAKGNLLPLPPNLASQSMNLPLYHALQTFLRLF